MRKNQENQGSIPFLENMREYLHAKIHRATVTEANLNYTGSITIDHALLEKTGLHEGQKVLVSNVTTGTRLETYIISGTTGEICMNGAAAHLMKKGDEIIIMGFEFSDAPMSPKVILVDKENTFVKYI